jgi:hypothetical protein
MEFPIVTNEPRQGVGPGPVSLDSAGNVYTTMLLGGNYNNSAQGNGGVVQVTPGGKTYSFLFDYSDGANPNDGVLVDASRGFLYGTTAGIGLSSFRGNVFEIDRSGKETVLYTFCQQPNCLDGYDPDGLYEDAAGNLFGVTSVGGSNGLYGDGVVFEIVRQ